MLFNTIDFVFFLPVVIAVYFAIPHRFRWMLLLAASYYFYMCWKLEYVFLIMASTGIDYVAGLQMAKKATRRARIPYLVLSLVTNLGLLFSFKYFNFFSENANLLLDKIRLSYDIPLIDVLLPVGISFYTFQTLSYSIDVFKGKQEAERHLGHFALYVSFFPQLVAGPIERFSRLSPQLKAKQVFTYENLANGCRLVLYGLFAKMVIADNLSPIVDELYKNPQDYHSLSVLTGLFFYSIQIYCDFFGYSSVAIGCALIMGIRIMDNFRNPYLAKNIAEFWQRWHISLSTWFRDYVYFPLGGNRVNVLFWMVNIMVVFTVSGVWHGARWNFVIWGALFGILYLLEKAFNRVTGWQKESRAGTLLHGALALKTFLAVTLIWVFFRSQTLDEAEGIFRHLVQNRDASLLSLDIPVLTWVLLGLFALSDLLLYNRRFDTAVGNLHIVLRWVIYAVLIFAILAFSGVDDFPFIYFQF